MPSSEQESIPPSVPPPVKKPGFFASLFKSKQPASPVLPSTGGKNKTSNKNRTKKMMNQMMPLSTGGKNKNDTKNDNKKLDGGNKKNKNQKLEVGGNKVYTGPRGGKYIMRNGDKVYLNK
jgi:hypothetical protein